VSGSDPGFIERKDFDVWNKNGEKRPALNFDLEITTRCNNDCPHCFINLPAGDLPAKARELTVPEIVDVSRQAVALGAVWCLVSGGEPLLREDFPEIFLGLKRLGLLVTVFTNATLLNEEHMKLFRTYPPRDLEVTVYGVTEETYERVTGRPGSFAAFQRGFEMLLRSGIRFRLKATITRSNFREISAIRIFGEQHSKGHFRIDPMLHGRFDGDARRNAMIRAERLTAKEIVELEQGEFRRYGSRRNINDDLLSQESAQCDHIRLFHCGAGLDRFSVGFDGTFRLCTLLWAPQTTFDLRRGTLKEAFETVVPRVRSERARNREFLDMCRKCPVIDLCLWCPARSHLEIGDMDTRVPYFCAIAHARAEAISARMKDNP